MGLISTTDMPLDQSAVSCNVMRNRDIISDKITAGLRELDLFYGQMELWHTSKRTKDNVTPLVNSPAHGQGAGKLPLY